MKLSLCMIVKNEENNIGRCLTSVKDIVDEIIIVDTGSIDRTIEISRSFGAKIYHFAWNNNFSDARNYSLEKATGEWILIMDADDELEKNDKSKVLKLIKTDADAYYFETLSYVGDKPGLDIIMNLNMRLIRNHRGYKFFGAIHEQITADILKKSPKAKILTEKIIVHHYGYLSQSVLEKNKRERNITIIENDLKENSEDAFMLFNMGNEYFALGDYNKALDYYKKSFCSFDCHLGFSPKLLIRYIMSLEELKQYEEEHEMIQIGLKHYPNYTDLEYIRACLYHKTGNVVLAIKGFNRCIELREPPSYLSFILGVGTYRAYHALSEIYFEYEDYRESYKNCLEALKCKPDFTSAFHRIAKILLKDKNLSMEAVKTKLEEFFGSGLEWTSNLMLAEIFLIEGKYEVAYEYLSKVEEMNKSKDEKLLYCKGVCLFFLKRFKEATEVFAQISIDNNYEKSLYYMALCFLLSEDISNALALLGKTESFKDFRTGIIYNAFIQLIRNDNPEKKADIICDDEVESREYINSIIELLDILLRLEEFEYFEKTLGLFNLIESNEVLLQLAKLYGRHNYYELAYKEIIRSIKVYEKIDVQGIELFRRSMLKKQRMSKNS